MPHPAACVLSLHGTPAAILLHLRDDVNHAVRSEGGYNSDDLKHTRERLEDLRHPVPFDA